MDCECFTHVSDLRYIWYSQGHWCQGMFPKVDFKPKLMSINWKQLYGVTMALAIWRVTLLWQKDTL